MNPARLAVMLVGFGLILMAALVLYFETDLRNQIPVGVAVAILLLLLGLIVIAFSDELRRAYRGAHYVDRTPVVERIETHRVDHVPEPRYDPGPEYDESIERKRIYRR